MEIKNSGKVTKAITLGAVGTLAAGALPSEVAAQDLSFGNSFGENGFSVSLEGAYAVSDFSKDLLGDNKLGRFDDDMGFYGSISLSRAINPEWDWRLSTSRLDFDRNSESDIEDDLLARGGMSLDSTMLDFDIGKNFNRGNTSFRLGGGLSAGTLNQSLDKGFSDLDTAQFVDSRIGSKFRGVGPRITGDISQRLNESSKFRIIAGADMSLLFGRFSQSKGLDAFIDDNASNIRFNQNDDGRVLATSLYLGMAYDASVGTSFKVGYRLDAFKDYDSSLDFNNSAEVSHAAFIGMDIRF